jgi:hypothetical protein
LIQNLKYYLCTIILCFLWQINLHAQNSVDDRDKIFTKTQKELNQKRNAIQYSSKEALDFSRECKTADAGYYLGWMFEGSYNHEIAADVIGYSNSIEPLEKARALMEKKFGAQLKLRTKEVMPYITIMNLHRDYSFINYALQECYVYTDQYEKAWSTVKHYLQYNLQDETYLDSYNTLCWMVHRNRFYTKEKYSFLKNNIAENEKYANQLLDDGVKKIYADEPLNKDFYQDYVKNCLQGVYHYKAILYSYAMNIPSAEYYFNEMKKNGSFSENNYGNFCSVQAKFKEAEKHYQLAAQNEPSDKRLREYVYFQSIIEAYKSKPKQALHDIQEYVKTAGTTPGYGWYQLGISRSLLNDGQFAQSNAFATLASNFREVHIGTTLGQSHYDFTTNLLLLMAKEQELASVKFENKKWYYSPSAIWKKIKCGVEKLLTQYIIINQLSNNPEREDVIYKLFSSESTVSFDEVWALLKDYSTGFFIKKFEKQLADEKRVAVKKYFQLILAKLYIKEKNYTKANELVQQIIADKNYDAAYEKLFAFRVAEVQLQLIQTKDKNANTQEIVTQMYYLYPQWMPYTDATIQCRQVIAGVQNDSTKKILASLSDANIDWQTQKTNYTHDAQIKFENKNNLHLITFTLVQADGKEMMPPFTFSYTTNDEAAKILKYSIFNIGHIQKNINMIQPKKGDII